MAKRRGLRTTLERRGRLIFGLMILLVVVACLFWPWYQMERLVRSGDPERAQAVVGAYLQHLHASRWFVGDATRVEQLSTFALKGKSRPQLIRLEPGAPDQPQMVPPNLAAFEAGAVEVFLRHPEENRYWQTDGDTFRYVRSLRADGACLVCHEDRYQRGELIGAIEVSRDLAERNKVLLANRIVLLAAALLVVVLSVVLFGALFRYMVVRPSQHLKDVADRVSEGNVLVRSEIATGDEFEALSDAMNHMLDELAKTEAELRAANAERDDKLEELARANVALFETNQVKNKFLATMSHELRTPLNSIIGFAQVLSEAKCVASDTKLQRYAQNIQKSGQMLLELINDLLDLAKIEAGRLEVRCEKVSPQDIAEATCNMVRPMIGDADLALTCEVDDATPSMVTDGTKVQQILYNLLTNAIKFTNEGEVRLTVRPEGDDRVAFAVSDTGIGIPGEQQPRIFERFTQLDASYTRRYGGTGLGLAIAKDLTGLLGGVISATSESGRGSTFTFVLPVDSSNAEGRSPDDMGAERHRPDAGGEGG